jgi:hypothetical protein
MEARTAPETPTRLSFLALPFGRPTRAGIGAALVTVGLMHVRGRSGRIVAAAGLLSLATGAFGVSMFTPLFRLPFVGRRLRFACPLGPRRLALSALRRNRRVVSARRER